MLGLANVIDGFGRVLHDVEAIEDNLVGGQRQGLQRGVDVRLPHVHRHDLDGGELLRRQRVEILAETRGRTALRDILDGAAINVADDRDVVLSATKRLLVHADPFDRSGFFASLTSRDRALHRLRALDPN